MKLCLHCLANEPTHLVCDKDYPRGGYQLVCINCVTRGLKEGWYPQGVAIRKIVQR